jgi:hypothetical protein
VILFEKIYFNYEEKACLSVFSDFKNFAMIFIKQEAELNEENSEFKG